MPHPQPRHLLPKGRSLLTFQSLTLKRYSPATHWNPPVLAGGVSNPNVEAGPTGHAARDGNFLESANSDRPGVG